MESIQEVKPGPGHQKEYKRHLSENARDSVRKENLWTCWGLLQMYHQQKEDEGKWSPTLFFAD